MAALQLVLRLRGVPVTEQPGTKEKIFRALEQEIEQAGDWI